MIAQIDNKTIYTIGHSNKQPNEFIDLLKNNSIKLLIDVRSQPYSQYNPQFNKNSLMKTLSDNEINYLFLGNCLGGRPKDPTCYKGGEIPKSKVNYLEAVNYAEVAKRDWYNEGIRLLLTRADGNRTAIMCSEENPNRCHRHHLIAHTLTDMGVTIKHIRGSGIVEEITPQIKREKLQQQLRFSDLDEKSPSSIDEKAYPNGKPNNTNNKIKIFTIGFTKKPAKRFFELLRENHVERILDIRLNPQGQLAGFAKKDDLPYFLRNLANCEYHHLLALAPTEEILSDYKNGKNWDKYVKEFEALMDKRDIPNSLDRLLFEEKTCCLLCSEATPEKCHRRLVAERLAKEWSDLEIIHLI